MAHLVRTARGKENFISSILKKHNIQACLTPEKGFLVCDSRPSPQLLFELTSYVWKVIEITEEEAGRLLTPEKSPDEKIEVGSLVEIIDGVYQNFKGIVRKRRDGRAVVDLNLFGRVLPVEVSIDEMKLSKVGDPWV